MYKKHTKKDLLTCNSASSILTVLQEQVQKLTMSLSAYTKGGQGTRWLDPTVKVLHALSETLERVSLSYASAHELV